MVGKLLQIENYCQSDDIVVLLTDWELTSLDGMDDLLIQLGCKDKIAVIDLRNHKLEEEGHKACRAIFATYKSLKVIYLKGNSVMKHV